MRHRAIHRAPRLRRLHALRALFTVWPGLYFKGKALADTRSFGAVVEGLDMDKNFVSPAYWLDKTKSALVIPGFKSTVELHRRFRIRIAQNFTLEAKFCLMRVPNSNRENSATRRNPVRLCLSSYPSDQGGMAPKLAWNLQNRNTFIYGEKFARRKKMNNPLQTGRLSALLITIRSSLWFIPAVVIVAAIGLAFGLIEIDQRYDDIINDRWPRLLTNEAEGARGMLSAIAGSMATVAGVVFSITIVALTLASSQYTSRVLRNFMRDRANQSVLGVFVGVYIYCLIVLRTVSDGEWEFVPSIAVMVAVLLAIIAIGFFIFFIHHISSTIQASEIIASVTRETIQAIGRLCPEEASIDPHATDQQQAQEGKRWHQLPTHDIGYIEAVNQESLLEFAKKHNTIVRMECAIGEFLAPGKSLASLSLREPPHESIVKEFDALYTVGSYRTIEQDAAFGIRQLVDIALKSLSPGINDTTTAVTCIEHLSVILAECGRRAPAVARRYDGDGKLRVIAKNHDFAQFVELSFDQILESAESNTAIMLRVLEAIQHVSMAISTKEHLVALRLQVRAVEDASVRSIRSEIMMKRVRKALESTDQLLDERQSAV